MVDRTLPKMKYILAIALLAVAACQAEKLRFDNHTLYRITPKSVQMVETLRQMEEEAYMTGYTFFTDTFAPNVSIDILVPPKLSSDFKTILDHVEVEGSLMHPNIQEAVDASEVRPIQRLGDFDWLSYHTLDDINAWLRQLTWIYNQRSSLFVAGLTSQGREILGVNIHTGPLTRRKRAVFIEANIHAREWITSATATYLLNELLVSEDPRLVELTDEYDWYIVPVANPDGFVHTHTSNRMWRKTRTPYSFLCFGADPNRNWPYQWMQGGASNSPCSDTYAGPSPLSESSTRTLSNFIDTVGNDLIAYISFHSYSQMLLLPYGHTTAHLDNYEEMLHIGRHAMNDLSVRYGTQYVVGNIAETIYVATEGSMDTVKYKFRTPIAYTYEMRDHGRNGFILPANEIIPNALETIDSLVSIFRQYRQRHPGA